MNSSPSEVHSDMGRPSQWHWVSDTQTHMCGWNLTEIGPGGGPRRQGTQDGVQESGGRETGSGMSLWKSGP